MKRTDQAFVRRNTVVEWRPAVIGAVAGLAATLAGANPVASQPLGAILTGLAVAVVTWAAASAPWWAVAAIAGLSGAIALQPAWAALGFAAFIGGLYIGVKRRDYAELRAVVAGVALNVLLHSHLGMFFGLSSIIGLAAATALFVLGIRRRPRAVRRPAWIGAGCVAGLAVLATAGFALSVSSSASALRDGNRLARQAIQRIDDGDYQGAADSFGAAQRALARADVQLDRRWAMGAALVPGIAQNRAAAVDVVAHAAAVSDDVEAALRTIDPDRLTLTDGHVDLTEIARVDAALAQVDDGLTALQQTIDSDQSSWLVAPLGDRLRKLDDDLNQNGARLDTARTAVALAPRLLGAVRSARARLPVPAAARS